MAAYEFLALDERGRQQRGVLEADSVRQIRQQLRDRGWAPLSVETASGSQRSGGTSTTGWRLRRGLSALDLAMITRHLATLIGSALPIEEALNAAAQQADSGRIKSMLMAIRGRVMEGYSLAQALAEYPAAFSDLFRATVASGEHSGHLEEVLTNLADYTERRQSSAQNVQLAMLYPVMLVVISIAIVSGLLIYVVPQIVGVYQDSQQELPLLTRGLIASSEFLQQWGIVLLLAIVGVAVALSRWLRQPGPRLAWDRALLDMPFVRRVVRGINASQFANTLAILTASGVPLVEAMQIAGRVVGNTFLRARIETATLRVSEGAALRPALEEVGYFPPLMLHMVGSGEASGQLDDMLGRVARHLEQDLERIIGVSIELFKPLTLLVMGVVVLIIVLAILLPIINLNQLIV